MSLKFLHLTRPNIRALRPGQKITEHGITVECLKDGDIRYSVAVMVDGQRIHRVIGRASDGTTRTQCEEFIAKARVDAKDDRLDLPSGRKLQLAFTAAADLYLNKLKETGGKDYVNAERHIRLHLKPYFGKMPLDKISTFTLQKFQNECRGKGLSESTINRILASYRRLGRQLATWKDIRTAPAMIKLAKEHNARTHVVTPDEEAELLRAALDDCHSYIWLFIKLGFATGLRHREMLSAKFDGFDPTRRRLRVRVKGGKQRQQPLTRGITDILLHEREMAADRNGWLFPSKRSPSGHVRSMGGPFARVVKQAGMDPSVVVPHTMRHTAITRLSETGADIKTIQEFSGHESIEMVLRYAHAQDRAVDRALDKMESGTVVEHPAAGKREKS